VDHNLAEQDIPAAIERGHFDALLVSPDYPHIAT